MPWPCFILIIEPFAAALFIAAVMAGAISPWYEHLAARLRGRRQIAAGLTTTAILLVVVLPLATVSVVLAKEISDGATYVRKTLRSEGVQGLVNDLPARCARSRRRSLTQLPQDQGDLQDLSKQQGGRAAAAVGGVLTATWGVIIQLVMMLIAFFFFLVDGPQLVDWFEDVMPLGRGPDAAPPGRLPPRVGGGHRVVGGHGRHPGRRRPRRLSDRAGPEPLLLRDRDPHRGPRARGGRGRGRRWPRPRSCTWAGIPVPRSSSCSGGSLAVGLIDNVVKPYLIRGGIELHGAVVFFALLGGLAYFGPVGLIAGPLVVSFFLAVVRMWDRDDAEPA